MSTPRTARLLHTFAALADLGEEIANTRDFEQMVRSTLHVVLGALGVRRGAVAEFFPAESSLQVVATWGIHDQISPAGFPVELKRHMLAKEYDATAAGARDCISFGDFERCFGPELKEELERLRIPLIAPLVVHNELVGVIMLGGKATDEPFNKEDDEIIRAMARHIGVGIYNHRLLREVEHRAEENEKLYEDLRSIYRNTVRAFAAAIDCKDKYTQGHSERVGKYSELIAREMGWAEDRIEDIAIGGYLHDVGKLVVERDIINAPYRIDAKQNSELNRHPAAGYEILAPINHPDATIPMIAKYHHERLDGRGYPEGLRGEEIPLSAKIVAVADSFDAMTTDRTYKRRKTFPEVVEDFRKNTGKQFAPEVVVALFKVILKDLTVANLERQFAPLLGDEYLEAEICRPLILELLAELESGERLTLGAH